MPDGIMDFSGARNAGFGNTEAQRNTEERFADGLEKTGAGFAQMGQQSLL